MNYTRAPSQILTKTGDGAAQRVGNLWHDCAIQQVETAAFHRFEQFDIGR